MLKVAWKGDASRLHHDRRECETSERGDTSVHDQGPLGTVGQHRLHSPPEHHLMLGLGEQERLVRDGPAGDPIDPDQSSSDPTSPGPRRYTKVCSSAPVEVIHRVVEHVQLIPHI